jgi:hypothetical protein
MPLSFAQAEFVLAFTAGISPKRASAFQARLKQWQKGGFPEGINVGRGVRAAYGAKQVYQLALVLRLLQVGLTPERAQAVVSSAWPAMRDGIIEATSCLAVGASHRHYFLVQLDALSDLKEESAPHDHIFVEQFTDEHIAEAFVDIEEFESDEDRRRYEYFQFWVKNRMALTISVEIDSILILIWAALQACGADSRAFADEMADWYADRAARRHAIQESKEYFDPTDVWKGSIVDRVENFDVIAAAREMLSKVEENERRKGRSSRTAPRDPPNKKQRPRDGNRK